MSETPKEQTPQSRTNQLLFFVKQKRLPFSEALISAPRRSKYIFGQCPYLNSHVI